MELEDLKSYILKHFTYNKDGTVTRDDRSGKVGTYDKDGYCIIKVKGKKIKAHRLIWLLNNGDFPNSEIDHINRKRNDNRIENLRESNRKQQANNTTRYPNKDTGVIGIYYDKSTKGLKSRYTFHCGKKTYRFMTLEEAQNKKKQLTGA